MSEFRIEKVRQQLELTLSSGEKLNGTVFLEPVARTHPGPQNPRELLNDDAAFFPFDVKGNLVLVSKEHVKHASYQSGWQVPALSPTTVGVRLLLSDGSSVDGSVEVEARSDAHRLLDFLNGFHGRFLALADRSTQRLVNRRMIAGVQQR
jgi:hypothetical protein